MRLDTTAMLDVLQAPSQDGSDQSAQPKQSTDEARAYVWIAKFALKKLR